MFSKSKKNEKYVGLFSNTDNHHSCCCVVQLHRATRVDHAHLETVKRVSQFGGFL